MFAPLLLNGCFTVLYDTFTHFEMRNQVGGAKAEDLRNMLPSNSQSVLVMVREPLCEPNFLFTFVLRNTSGPRVKFIDS